MESCGVKWGYLNGVVSPYVLSYVEVIDVYRYLSKHA